MIHTYIHTQAAHPWCVFSYKCTHSMRCRACMHVCASLCVYAKTRDVGYTHCHCACIVQARMYVCMYVFLNASNMYTYTHVCYKCTIFVYAYNMYTYTHVYYECTVFGYAYNMYTYTRAYYKCIIFVCAYNMHTYTHVYYK